MPCVRSLPVFCWRHFHVFLELRAEMRVAVVAGFIGYPGYVRIRCQQEVAGVLYAQAA